MTDQVSISTATQGASAAAPKAQAGGKGSGFLGMLMAAIGHKPVPDTSTQAAGTAMTAKATKGKSQAMPTLLAMAGDTSTQHAKGKAAALIDAVAKATVGTGHAQASKASVTQNKTGLLVGAAAKAGSKVAQAKADAALAAAAAKAAADHGQGSVTAEGDSTQGAKGKAGHGAMAKHQAKDQHHPTKTSSDDASGTASPTAMPQVAVAVAAPQPAGHGGTQTATDAPDHQAHAQGRASAPMAGPAGHAALAATAGMRTQAGASSPSDAHAALTRHEPGTSPATVEATNRDKAMMPSSAPSSATASAHGAAIAGQAAVDIAAAGMQAGSQHSGKDGTRGTAKASSTAAMSSGGKTAKGRDAGMNMAAAHPQDAVATNSHAGSPDAPGGTAARPSLPQTGIQSYSQVAGGLARPLPAQATLITHKDQAAGLRADAATGPASIPGQDTTAGNMAWATGQGIGQNAQTMASPQTAMPQAPVHSSGPWTAMAAMAEIGQAAANGHSRLELKLEPAHLGKVHVRIDSDSHKNIQVHLIVEQAASHQAIEQQLPSLRHALEQQGLNLGNFSMSSQHQGSGQESGQQGQQQATTASVPGFHGAQASTPQIPNAPTESSGSGRLSIRI